MKREIHSPASARSSCEPPTNSQEPVEVLIRRALPNDAMIAESFARSSGTRCLIFMGRVYWPGWTFTVQVEKELSRGYMKEILRSSWGYGVNYPLAAARALVRCTDRSGWRLLSCNDVYESSSAKYTSLQ